MKSSALDQQTGFGEQYNLQTPNQLVFEVEAELIGEAGNKETRAISMDDYKAAIERLYFR